MELSLLTRCEHEMSRSLQRFDECRLYTEDSISDSSDDWLFTDLESPLPLPFIKTGTDSTRTVFVNLGRFGITDGADRGGVPCFALRWTSEKLNSTFLGSNVHGFLSDIVRWIRKVRVRSAANTWLEILEFSLLRKFFFQFVFHLKITCTTFTLWFGFVFKWWLEEWFERNSQEFLLNKIRHFAKPTARIS